MEAGKRGIDWAESVLLVEIEACLGLPRRAVL